MSTIPPPRLIENAARPMLEPSLVQLMAVRSLNTRFARLVDGGADADTQVELASLFVDLPVRATIAFGPGFGAKGAARDPQPQMFNQGLSSERHAMPTLLGYSASSTVRRSARSRWLLVGGPGSGKSTLTTMMAHVLRRSWVDRQLDVLPSKMQEQWAKYCERFDAGLREFPWAHLEGALPIRIDLPTLSQWLASRVNRRDESLWDFLAYRANKELGLADIQADITTSQWQSALTVAGSRHWILDGLDEVPDAADRKRMLEFLRPVLFAKEHQHDALVVATRPQGYGAEFKELDDMELQPLDQEAALEYGHRLLGAYIPPGPLLEEKHEQLEEEFDNSDVQELLHTPLHTTMAALLVARVGNLPNARCKLFDAYFDMVFRRELGKPFDMGIQIEDEPILRDLHQRVGFTLHVRAQEGTGVKPSLRRRDLKRILEQVYADQGYRGEQLQEHVERMMRFAMDRLVLLLHSAEGEYTFGIRSLEEYFAADELLQGETEIVRTRLVDIVLNPHWQNVIAIMTSRLALVTEKSQQKRALRFTTELFADVNAGKIGGEAAKKCLIGSRMAIVMLGATGEYARPWLVEPLWKIALELATAHQEGILRFARLRLLRRESGAWTDHVDMHGMLGALALAANRQNDILYAARTQLEANDEDTQLNGWRLLGPLLDEGKQEALELANRHLPSTPEMARAIATALLDFGQDQTWLWPFIEERLDWLTPLWGIEAHVEADEKSPITLQIHRALIARFETPDDGGYFYQCETEALKWPLVFLGPENDPEWAKLAAQTPETTPAWRAWKRVAEFHAHPSHLTLANVLDAASEESAFDDLRRMNLYFPWPLAACLDCVYDCEELTKMAESMREGRLGTIDDWRAAENRWRAASSLSLEDIQAALDTDAPWLPDIAKKGWVLTTIFEATDRTHAESRALNDWLSRRMEDGRSFKPLVAKLFDDTLHIESRLPMKYLAHMHASIVDYLNKHGRPAMNQWPAEPPTQATLRDVVVWCMGEQALADAEKRDPATFLHEFFTTLQMPSTFTAYMTSLASTGQQAVERLVTALDAPDNAGASDQNFLLAQLFAKAREAVKPSFVTEDEWNKHALQPPFLAAQPPPERPAQLVRLVDLRNIRIFRETPIVETPFPAANPDQGQWIVFIGENGIGKTTLLRALALVLASPAIATKLLDERYPMLTNGTDGHIAIDLDTGTLAATIRREQRTEVLTSNTPNVHRPWVVAYGVRRGNARGEKDREPETGPIGELHTLFDRPASLHNASAWLSGLKADVFFERDKAPKDSPPGPRELVWNAVVEALKELLHVQSVEVEAGGNVFVKHEAFGRVPLNAMSDGYLTTAGWAIDMIARWIERQRELDELIDEQWMKQMKGFVLIDEIDLHLHPIWQMRIIDDIRRLFPRLSFIVTTHNPLTLQAARRGEIYVMRREEKGIHFVQKDVRPGQDVDRVLFEQFGIKYTFDKKTRDLLERHRVMLGSGVNREDPKRKEVEAQLNERLGLVGEAVGREGDRGPLGPDERHLTAKFRKKPQAN